MERAIMEGAGRKKRRKTATLYPKNLSFSHFVPFPKNPIPPLTFIYPPPTYPLPISPSVKAPGCSFSFLVGRSAKKGIKIGSFLFWGFDQLVEREDPRDCLFRRNFIDLVGTHSIVR